MMFSLYWCRTLPPLKLCLCICSILVREICYSSGIPRMSSSNTGFPAVPCSWATALFYKNCCQGWDVSPFSLLRFWKFATTKWNKTSKGSVGLYDAGTRQDNLDSCICINIKKLLPQYAPQTFSLLFSHFKKSASECHVDPQYSMWK